MREVFRAHRVIGRIPRSDRIGGEVQIYAVFHAFHSKTGLLEMLGYWGADDGANYPVPSEEFGRSETASSAEAAEARARTVCQDWLIQLALDVGILNAKLARGEIQLPGEARLA